MSIIRDELITLADRAFYHELHRIQVTRLIFTPGQVYISIAVFLKYFYDLQIKGAFCGLHFDLGLCPGPLYLIFATVQIQYVVPHVEISWFSSCLGISKGTD